VPRGCQGKVVDLIQLRIKEIDDTLNAPEHSGIVKQEDSTRSDLQVGV